MFRVSHLIVLFGTLCLFPGLAPAQPAQLRVTADRTVYDDVTKETVLTGNAQLVNGDTVLRADEIRYNSATGAGTEVWGVTGTAAITAITGAIRA
ncbi:MAG TPA: LptA/OstA family protein, partial [Lacunisphaera sp.]|nr:LptA/OstA family protein [Lacunisphaera sp.]